MNYVMSEELKNKLVAVGYKGGFGLEELIDACNNFDRLERVVVQGVQMGWIALSTLEDYKELGCRDAVYPTPIEAVANLWLKLNEKHD